MFKNDSFFPGLLRSLPDKKARSFLLTGLPFILSALGQTKFSDRSVVRMDRDSPRRSPDKLSFAGPLPASASNFYVTGLSPLFELYVYKKTPHFCGASYVEFVLSFNYATILAP